jgi:hypothetical protein
MKLILSRKGFDSASGGGPSPILPDGRMISLPIPEAGEAGIPYGELQIDDTRSYADLMQELHIPIRTTDRAHLDPDLCAPVRPRPAGWRPLFGQCGAAQRHLALQQVGPGDLFLFFGLFRRCVGSANGPIWDRTERPFHAVWGYLQIEAVHQIACYEEASHLPWACHHPHLVDWHRPFNTVYVATEHLSLAPQLAGAGVFMYHDRLRLSAPGTLLSHWSLPSAFLPEGDLPTLTYHGDPRRWERHGDRVLLQTVGRGQEFITDACPELQSWLLDIIARDPSRVAPAAP